MGFPPGKSFDMPPRFVDNSRGPGAPWRRPASTDTTDPRIMLKRSLCALLWAICAIGHALAAEPAVDLATAGKTVSFTRAALLARADAADIEVARDVSYGKPMRYRAVPLADLLAGTTLPAGEVLETRAADGFAAQLPMDLVLNRDPSRAVAWLAIEEPARPWPKLPGKAVGAGPFYLVWVGRQAVSVRSEQWPYQVTHLALQPSPAARWPALAVDAALPATDPVRAGQTLFITQCLACHRLNGAGSSNTGPRPQPADEPDRILPAGRPASLYPQPRFGARLAGPRDAGLLDGAAQRSRDRSGGELPGVHGRAQAPGIGCQVAGRGLDTMQGVAGLAIQREPAVDA